MARRRHMLGEVNLLGLDEFGQNHGLNPIWGAAIGGGVAGTTSLALRHATSVNAKMYADLYGLGAGLATAGALFAMKSTRHAALGAAVGAVVASGISWLGGKLFDTTTVAIPAAAAPSVAAAASQAAASGVIAGMGIPNIRSLNGLGIPQARALNGLGIPNISATPHAQGTIPGVAGSQLSGSGQSSPPVSLLGPGSPQATHLRGIGGPAVHGLSAAYGATLLGGGRG